jgi:hypothetical protein
MTTGEKVLAESIKYIGTTEWPMGSNKQVFGKWFGYDGVAWCAMFVSFCFKVGADYTLCAGFGGPGAAPRGNAFCPTIGAWGKKAGLWIGKETPHAGDIVLFDWQKDGISDHIGIVESYTGNTRFVSIEGNTSLGNNSNGGAVMRRGLQSDIRSIDQVLGFIRIV